MLSVRKAVRSLRADDVEDDLSGAENLARWETMMDRIHRRDRLEAERRLAEVEVELNRLGRQ
jgi:hypothetical protein